MPIETNKNENTRFFGAGRSLLGAGKKQQEELEWYHNHDSFAGLSNMNALGRDFGALTQKDGWVLVLIHINGFIRLNSIFGLDMGGKTIQRICPILDTFARRVGGEAYRISLGRLVVLAPAPDREVFRTGLEDALHTMEEVMVEDGMTVYSYHYSFAYSAYFLSDAPEDFHSLEGLLSFCDIAAQNARNDDATVGEVFDLKRRPNWASQEQFLPSVKEAWKNQEFEPCYQPIYDMRSNKPVGAELLIRWRHPERGLIPPADFLPLMEAEGLMMDMDLYMLAAACQMIKSWMDRELVTIPLSINICKQNIHRADFLPRVIEIVMSYDIPPVLIELELHESAVVFEKNDFFYFTMEQLHRMGLTLTMDDCGSSEYSSVSLMRELPLDTVKINRRFLNKVGESERDRIYAMNILRMAKELGIRTIATGVETKEEADTWLNLGCSIGQGYYFSKPLFTDDFEQLIF